MNSAQPTVATFIYTSRAKCSPGCSFRPKKNINGYICTMNNGSNMVPNSIKSIPLNISIIGLWLWFYQPRFPCRVRGGVASGVPRCYLDFPAGCGVRGEVVSGVSRCYLETIFPAYFLPQEPGVSHFKEIKSVLSSDWFDLWFLGLWLVEECFDKLTTISQPSRLSCLLKSPLTLSRDGLTWLDTSHLQNLTGTF